MIGFFVVRDGFQYEIVSMGTGKDVRFRSPAGRRVVSTVEEPAIVNGMPQPPGECVVWDLPRITALPEGTRVRTSVGRFLVLKYNGRFKLA